MRKRRPHNPEAPRRKPPEATRTDWGDVAQWYDKLVGEAGSEFHREVVLPGVVRLLDLPQPADGAEALDVACGQGVLCRILQARGVKAVGIDASEELIRLARERSNPAIAFHVGDAKNLSRFPADHFAAAACVLAIQNIDPIGPVCQGVARCLKPGGRFVIAMMHPCFRGPKATFWRWDEKSGVQYRRVDRYLLHRREPIVTHPGSDPSGFTWTFHRPLQAYIAALAAAGLMVDALEEWPSHKVSDSGPRAPAENAARKEIPMFLALRAVKPG
ncbi:MAG: class I SAM-dependent methyltransferase [Planctomycetota bacterium]|nr:class I SAM-dependent methyltransferase [Planctomycetota bacterium]